jgi:hypothetical protein
MTKMLEKGKKLSGYINDIIKSFHQSFFIAWRDSNPQSSQLLKWEETIYKQYRHDVKKYNKKYNIDDDGKKKSKSSRDKEKKEKEVPPAHIPPPPVLKRPPLSPQLDALLQVIPSFVSKFDLLLYSYSLDRVSH